jgi:hypothetical protein
VCSDLSSQLTNNFLSKIIIRDEKWRIQYVPESKRRSFEWRQPTFLPPKQAHVSKSLMKKMFIALFDIKGIFHFSFIPQGQTVNEAYYVEILKQLHGDVRKKWPELWPND